jgi:5-(carboxyamino)imidazole ribonucleotide mutase
MMNLLGNDFRGNYMINRRLYNDCYDSEFKIHLYGKKTHFPERKMGHMTKLLTPEEQKGEYIYYNHDIMRQLFIPIEIDIVMGSISDGPVVQKAVDVLDKLNIGYSKRILSAHRMPYQMVEYAKDSNKNCVKVIIACAGGAAHLPGMIASMTVKPVIGLPAKTTALNGLDSLYSIVQMPKGVPVATVAIDNGENAALLACRILALQDNNIRMKLVKYHQKMNKDAIDSNLLLC